MLGPESPIYEPLPSPASIRILFLAPGQPEDDVNCFLFPCDLDKDHSIDPSVPRPFESLCIAATKDTDVEDEKQRFMLPLDSYIDDENEEVESNRSTGTETSGSETVDQQASDPASRKAEQLDGEDTASNTVSGNEQTTQTSASDEKRQIDRDLGGAVSNKGNEDEPEDDVWDLMQLTRLIRADGALDSSLQRHPFQRYTALSYVWGSVENPEFINLIGETQTKFGVTKNLLGALKSLRRSDMARALWIDAICINQNDQEEKKVQIGLMRRVYRQAQQVIAYVPQTQEDTDHLRKLFEKIWQAGMQCLAVLESGNIPKQQDLMEDSQDPEQTGGELRDGDQEPDTDDPSFRIRHLPIKPTGTCIEDYDIPADNDPAWWAWRRFFASPYFRRMWILQEFALARNLYLHFGREQGNLKADILLVVMHSVKSMSRMLNAQYLGRGENAELTGAAVLGWMGLEKMTLERIITQNGTRSERLIDKLSTGLLFDATDPRDKIYALLGLVSDADQFMNLVSYQSSDTYTKIYRRFAKTLIDHGHFIEIMQMACRTSRNPQLPSWVPDWSSSMAESKNTAVPLDRGFQAGGSKLSLRIDFPAQKPDHLILPGHIVSTISCKTSAFVPYNGGNKYLGNSVGRLQDFFETLLEAVGELCTHLDQGMAKLIIEVFHPLTMQLRTIESSDRENPEHSQLYDDLFLWRSLIVRLFQYSQIEGHADRKVEFGAMPEEDRDFIQKVVGNVNGRCLCVTSPDNRIGLVPAQAEVGDSLAILDGVPMPFVLRENPESASDSTKVYSLVGDAYVTGIMQGQLAQDNEESRKRIILC